MHIESASGFTRALQNTIAGLKTLIPTLVSTFDTAGISERESWKEIGHALLKQLEAETEELRRKYDILKQRPAPNQQQDAAFTSKSASTVK